MRYQEIKTLLEYDRSKTIQALSNGILRAAQRDSYLQSRNLDDEQTVAAVIDAAESADPTPNEQYVQWIVRQFTKKGMKYEDLYKLEDQLETFVSTKGQHKRLGINSDINQYDWRSLADTARKLSSTDVAEPDTADATSVEGAKILYNGPLGTLSVPQTEAASCELGRGTRWCTAADKSNMFDHYNSQGPLYIWHDKKLKEKFQFHFESGQFMDAQDNPISRDDMHYLTHKNSVTKKLFAKKSPLLLDLYLDRIEIDFERTQHNIDKDADDLDYEYADLAGEEILDVNIEAILGAVDDQKILKSLKPALLYSNEDTDFSDLKNSIIKHIISNPELFKKAQENNSNFNHWYKKYMISDAPIEDAVSYVLNSDSENQAAEALRVATRAENPIPELESIIAKDGREAYLYAYHKLDKQRFRKGEPEIAKDAWAATYYVKNILKQRWPEAEPAIKKYDANWKIYQAAINEN
jgi:hypothetical protein